MKTGKPNILIIWGDDIGWFNVSMNNGIMGYRTPNIDRVAKEGCNFTDCTVSRAVRPRAAFITGQSPIRTGLTKVGSTPTSASSPGSRLPTCSSSATSWRTTSAIATSSSPPHGFDEFFGVSTT